MLDESGGHISRFIVLMGVDDPETCQIVVDDNGDNLVLPREWADAWIESNARPGQSFLLVEIG